MNQVISENNQRLTRLELECRFLKVFVAVLCLGITSLLLMAQAPRSNRSLEAEHIVIKDKSGTTRAVFGMGAVLGEGQDTVGAQFLGRDGTTRLQLFLRHDEAPFVQLRDRQGNVIAQLRLRLRRLPRLGALFAPSWHFSAKRGY